MELLNGQTIKDIATIVDKQMVVTPAKRTGAVASSTTRRADTSITRDRECI